MSIKYKINILAELKKIGYSTYRLRKEKIFAERTLQKIRNEEIVNSENLNKLCELLQCQPGDLLEYRNANQNDDNQSAKADAEQDPTEQQPK